MLLVNGRYRGRLDSAARALIRDGKRVGIIWTDDETTDVQCHVCERKSTSPELDPAHKDALWNCPGCETPFVVTHVSNAK